MFDPADFLAFADNCANGNEAERRSAMSRTYYSVFLQAREHLRKKGILYPSGTGDDHKAVVVALRTLDLFVGNVVDDLRRRRGLADYNLGAKLTATEAINAVMLARTIWPKL